jgi:hypothetical protein
MTSASPDIRPDANLLAALTPLERFVIKACRPGGTRGNILALKDYKVLPVLDCLAQVCIAATPQLRGLMASRTVRQYCPGSPALAKSALALLLKISNTTGFLPTGLHATGVIIETHSVSRTSGSDVHQGRHLGELVAVKRLRMLGTSTKV